LEAVVRCLRLSRTDELAPVLAECSKSFSLDDATPEE